MPFPATAAYFPYAPAAWLQVQGPDAASFLQGQFTQDLRPVQGAKVAYGLWLDQKGKVLGDSFIGHGSAADEYWIASLLSPGPVLRQRLEAYLIADEVTVVDGSAEYGAVALLGEGTGAWLASAARPGHFFPGRRSLVENWEWIFPAAAKDVVSAALAGARVGSAEELERARILAGVPAVPVDIGPRDLPNEGGLDADAISFTKGCYLGQEVMARLKSKGRIRRSLHRVGGPGAAPAVPAALWHAGRKLGELRSTALAADGASFVGLALLAVGQLPEAEGMALGADDPETIRVLAPPH
jgi:folate-binding protein YgfZ